MKYWEKAVINQLKKIIENSTLDVEKEIIGKKTYRSGNNVEFTNGLMITFPDNVTPTHYQGNKFEVIDIIEDFDLNFCLGNAIKYILRCDLKGKPIEDLEKAIFYLNDEIKRRKNA